MIHARNSYDVPAIINIMLRNGSFTNTRITQQKIYNEKHKIKSDFLLKRKLKGMELFESKYYNCAVDIIYARLKQEGKKMSDYPREKINQMLLIEMEQMQDRDIEVWFEKQKEPVIYMSQVEKDTLKLQKLLEKKQDAERRRQERELRKQINKQKIITVKGKRKVAVNIEMEKLDAETEKKVKKINKINNEHFDAWALEFAGMCLN